MRVMLPWQSEHTLLPTKCAPSICGGSTTVRPGVEHELTNATLRPTSANATAETNHRQSFIGKWIFRKRLVTEKLAFLSRRHLTKARHRFKLQLRLGTILLVNHLNRKCSACGFRQHSERQPGSRPWLRPSLCRRTQ